MTKMLQDQINKNVAGTNQQKCCRKKSKKNTSENKWTDLEREVSHFKEL